MANQRHPIALNVAIKQGTRVLERLRVSADPDFPEDLRQILLDSMWRKDRRREHNIGNYVMDVWRVGRDHNPHKPFVTLAYNV